MDMDNIGAVREELDIKILILYILNRLPGAADETDLSDLCMNVGGLGYFDYSECLSDLIDAGLIKEAEDGLTITRKGSINSEAVETSLPYSIRAKALKALEPVAEKMRRAAMITAKHGTEDGNCMVSLSMSDGAGEIISMKFLCAGEEQAGIIEKNFKRDAEQYYHKIIEILSEDRRKKK